MTSRTLALLGSLAITAAIGPLLPACSHKSSGSSGAPESDKPARMTLEVLVLDEQPDPFAKLPDPVPKGMAMFQEVAVLGPEAIELRAYVRLVVQPGETFAQATQRAKPWFDAIPLPPGDRLIFGKIEEENEVTKVREAVGVRTYIATGPNILTQDDIADASLGAAPDENQKPQPVAMLSLLPDAAERFRLFTKKNALRRIAVLVSGYVVTSARIQDEISGGKLSIAMDAETPYDLKRAQLQQMVDGLKPKPPTAVSR